MTELLEKRLYGPGPKRILALDGGGVRGALSLEYLAHIEAILAERAGTGDAFRLAHYFDLIGGTSTGALIAACLALGYPVSLIQGLYRSLADAVFTRPWWRVGVFAPKYNADRLRQVLDEYLGDRTMGTDDLLTGLVVITKRLDTKSTWPITNLRHGRYFLPRPTSNAIPNRDYLLHQVVRASTAAPHYFDAERIRITDALSGEFIDGGVSMANNPALQLLLISQLKGFTLQWSPGPENLILVSVGTGSSPATVDVDGLFGGQPTVAAARALLTLMDDATALNETILQWVSNSPTARVIDREIGDLGGDLITPEPLMHYLRYNVELDAPWLAQKIGYSAEPALVARLRAMDDAGSVPQLAQLGHHAARQQIKPEHFPKAFDPA